MQVICAHKFFMHVLCRDGAIWNKTATAIGHCISFQPITDTVSDLAVAISKIDRYADFLSFETTCPFPAGWNRLCRLDGQWVPNDFLLVLYNSVGYSNVGVPARRSLFNLYDVDYVLIKEQCIDCSFCLESFWRGEDLRCCGTRPNVRLAEFELILRVVNYVKHDIQL